MKIKKDWRTPYYENPAGDTISPFIFTIAVEILLIKKTTSKNIKEITLET